MKRNNYYMLLCLMLVLLYPIICIAYMPTLTHPLINEKALQQSGVDDFIKYQIGFANGIEQELNGFRVWQWIRQGGTDEDANIRGLFHFHDPTKSWAYAGILSLGFSSLDWAQNNTVGPVPTCSQLTPLDISSMEPSGGSNPDRSWPGARAYFYQALTSSDPVTREQSFGKTFKYLGHVMHLLADAAVPEHTRNDQQKTLFKEVTS